MTDHDKVTSTPETDSGAQRKKTPDWLAGSKKQNAKPPDADGGDTLVFKRSHFYALMVPLAFVLGLGVGFLFWGRQPAVPAAAPMPEAAQVEAQPQAVKRYDVPEDDDPAIGPENAPITIIEFSDFECPYCSRWYEQVFLRLREEYPDTVRIVFRDFPLSSIHPNAIPAAEAANCAGEQNAYWDFHGKLFSGQRLGSSVYLQYAKDLGLNVEDFQSCLESGRYQSEIQADYQYASDLGVQSTPTFFLNGIPIVGAQPWEVFQQVIEKELAGEIPQ
jgi:protein-disulfide isomerase